MKLTSHDPRHGGRRRSNNRRAVKSGSARTLRAAVRRALRTVSVPDLDGVVFPGARRDYFDARMATDLDTRAVKVDVDPCAESDLEVEGYYADLESAEIMEFNSPEAVRSREICESFADALWEDNGDYLDGAYFVRKMDYFEAENAAWLKRQQVAAWLAGMDLPAVADPPWDLRP